eukprot:3681508-Rhodomonas_salina.1
MPGKVDWLLSRAALVSCDWQVRAGGSQEEPPQLHCPKRRRVQPLPGPTLDPRPETLDPGP